jgi:hypothetical protein
MSLHAWGTDHEKNVSQCEEVHHTHGGLNYLSQHVKNISTVLNSDSNPLYAKIKKEFETSAFCDPFKIVNDPKERMSGILLGKVFDDLAFIHSSIESTQNKLQDFHRLSTRYELGPGVTKDVDRLITNMGPYGDAFRAQAAKAKFLIIKEIMKNAAERDDYLKETLKDQLVAKKIFREDQDGNAECPFPSEDAFNKAVRGQAAILKTNLKGSVTNPNIITIVDYTRPSNERRLFVIDLKTKKVLHNTWVAEGGGGDINADGSSPKTSNDNNSRKSSDGFILAQKAGSGSNYGANIGLKGIDQANFNIASRGIVMHGWSNPYGPYTTGVPIYDVVKEEDGPPQDTVSHFNRINLKDASMREMERALDYLKASVSVTSKMAGTDGCLGVPTMAVPQLDRLGRKKNQLELLREDLPGSLIFSYSGENMQSKYFSH